MNEPTGAGVNSNGRQRVLAPVSRCCAVQVSFRLNRSVPLRQRPWPAGVPGAPRHARLSLGTAAQYTAGMSASPACSSAPHLHLSLTLLLGLALLSVTNRAWQSEYRLRRALRRG